MAETIPMAEAISGRARCRAHRASSGFTLFELLISLVILSLVIVLLANGVRLAGRAWDTEEGRSASQDDLTAVQGLLRSMIASGRQFQGDGTGVQFVGTMPQALEQAGLYDIGLTAAGDQLVLSYQPHQRPNFTPPPPQRATLARGIAALNFRYFFWDNDKQVGAWSGAAPDPKQAPALVQIGLGLPAGDRRVWSPLVVAPMRSEGLGQ